MVGGADLVQSQLLVPPAARWCRGWMGGHTAPRTWVSDGRMREVRFYSVSSSIDPKVNGIYCELCLVLAHRLACVRAVE